MRKGKWDVRSRLSAERNKLILIGAHRKKNVLVGAFSIRDCETSILVAYSCQNRGTLP